MKFMRITGPKDTFLTLPAAKQSELTAASFAFFDKYMKAKKCMDWYMLTDGRWVTTWDFDSIEEMARIIMEEPMRVYITAESLPYLDYQIVSRMRADAAATARPAKK